VSGGPPDRASARAWEVTDGPARDAATLPSLLLAAARRNLDAIAVRQWDAAVCYRDLLTTAATLASELGSDGDPEVPVGVCARRTVSLPVAIIAVLASGAAYVPLDPEQPRQRLAAIIASAGVRSVLVDAAGRAALDGLGLRMISADEQPPERLTLPAATELWSGRLGRLRPDNAAYVMYTSGSTGTPKGVVISQRAAVAFVTTLGRVFRLDRCASIGFASISFDASVIDILAPLAHGGAVQLVPDADRLDAARLQRFLAEHGVTWGMIPQAILPMLDPDRLGDLTDLLVGGEAADPRQVERWTRGGRRRVHNLYGPTEGTVCVTAAELAGLWDSSLPIGWPLPGCGAYVLGADLRPCAPGTAGELYVSGHQVARGYTGEPGQTALRFLPDPFASTRGSRMYRTGDLVMRGAGGMLTFLGRTDRQVKIRGQRVEAGEIETILRGHPGVRQVAAEVLTGPDGEAEIVAFLTPADGPDLAEIRRHCQDWLPGYMIPGRVIRLADLPLRVSGKVDSAELRALAASRSEPVQAPARHWPLTEQERVVAQAWRKLLGSAAGPQDDFFDRGGHSVLAMRLAAHLRAGTGRAVTVDDIFAGRTAAGVARRVAVAPPDEIDRRGPPVTAELSSAQRRIWFVEQIAPGSPVHNVALAMRLRGPLDVAALEAALAAVARRQDVLRWRIEQADGAPRVSVRPELPVLSVLTAPPAAACGQQWLAETLSDAAARPFDLAAEPPWRTSLIRLAADDHVLSVVIHHIVFDGWSQEVLYRELAASYRAVLGGDQAEPPGPARGYGDYVRLLAQRQAAVGQRDLDWWVAHLSGTGVVLDLPRDYRRPATRRHQGASSEIRLGSPLVRAVDDLAAGLACTRHATLLAAFGILLSRLTGQRDFVVGVPAADRKSEADEQVIGLFLQILPLRCVICDAESFAAHVRRCQAETQAALARPDTPLERIVDALKVPRDPSRGPLIQVMFNLLSFPEPQLRLPGVAAEPLDPGLPGSLFDLTFYVREAALGLVVRAVYDADLFAPERVSAMLGSYASLLADLAGHPERPVARAALRPRELPASWTVPLPGRAGPSLIPRIREVWTRSRDAIAVAGPASVLRYQDLADVATRTANVLRAGGSRSGDATMVIATRCELLPPVLLGVALAGGRWAVADAAHPAPYLASLIAAISPAAIIDLAERTDLAAMAGPGARLVRPAAVLAAGISTEIATGHQLSGAAPPPGYLSLTSGTTGEPRIIETGFRPLEHFLSWYIEKFELDATDRFSMLSGLGHDPLLRDVFTPLALGAQVRVPPAGYVREPLALIGWLRREDITVVHLTPQLARALASATGPGPAAPDRAVTSLRLVALGGDQATHADAAGLSRLAPNAMIVNFYGTSETPQAQSWLVATPPRPPGRPPADPLPVGRGIDGAQLLVLAGGPLDDWPAGDDWREAVTGELGQVVIRSRYLAAGYADPRLTARRFSRTPGGDPADRMFWTGDLGRYRPDGTVVLAGRSDDQIKISGYRVERAEVESVLAAHPLVRQACVTIGRGGHGQPALRAFAVPAGVADADELRDHLRDRLPAQAVPAEVTLLRALPVTPNGKVDVAALPPPTAAVRTRRREDRASTSTERLVESVWLEVLNRPGLAAVDSVFDLGADSFAAVAVAARLSGLLGAPVPVLDVLRYPTVRALARHLDGEPARQLLIKASQRAAQRQHRMNRMNRRQAATRIAEQGTSDES